MSYDLQTLLFYGLHQPVPQVLYPGQYVGEEAGRLAQMLLELLLTLLLLLLIGVWVLLLEWELLFQLLLVPEELGRLTLLVPLVRDPLEWLELERELLLGRELLDFVARLESKPCCTKSAKRKTIKQTLKLSDSINT